MKNASLKEMLDLLRPLKLYSLREDSLVYAELAGYAAGFALLYDRLTELSREAFVPTAESFGLENREMLMGFPANSKLDTARRRELLCYTISMAPGDYDLAGMENGLRSIGLDAVITEDRERERIHVASRAFLGNFISYDRLRQDALRILPAHLEVEFEFGGLTWDDLEEKDRSFDEIDALDLTWDEFELISPSAE